MKSDETKMPRQVICITPTKNEAWCIERHLQCASIWADQIILLDQNSTDDTLKIASRFPKVKILRNPSLAFNEAERQKILIKEARKLKGKNNIIIALDADECLTANLLNSNEWERIQKCKPGTNIVFDLFNISPGLDRGWEEEEFCRGFVDDYHFNYSPKKNIHVEKVPINHNIPRFYCQKIKILHYQFTDWDRMESKHRWYQAWEVLQKNHDSPIRVFRKYHHMLAIPKSRIMPLEPNWLTGYETHGIKMLSVNKEHSYYWDKQVLSYLDTFGAKKFSKIAIWDKKWQGHDDPRNMGEKLLFRYLIKSQKYSSNYLVRIFDKILKTFFAL